jgi:hypothetical protein
MDTRGNTELGVRLDHGACDLTQGNFTEQSGAVRLQGNLVLNYVSVRCSAQINLCDLKGTGRLAAVATASSNP